MKILVINCGSSSLKYQVLDMNGEVLLAKGLVERIGLEGSVITHEKIGMDKVVTTTPMENHKKAIALVLEAIINKEHGVVNDMSEIQVIELFMPEKNMQALCSLPKMLWRPLRNVLH